MEESVALRFFKVEKIANEVLDRFHEEINKIGFSANEVDLKQPSEAEYRLERDPSNSEYSLVGDWLNERGNKLGTLLFHADGSFFVELNVIRPHPTKPGWFVDALKAWGENDEIRTEARLLQHPY